VGKREIFGKKAVQQQSNENRRYLCDALVSLSLQQRQRCVFCSFEEEEKDKRRGATRTTEPCGEEAEEG